MKTEWGLRDCDGVDERDGDSSELDERSDVDVTFMVGTQIRC